MSFLKRHLWLCARRLGFFGAILSTAFPAAFTAQIITVVSRWSLVTETELLRTLTIEAVRLTLVTFDTTLAACEASGPGPAFDDAPFVNERMVRVGGQQHHFF